MTRVLAIDLGTGSLKAGVLDTALQVHALASAPIATSRRRSGVAEQSPAEWFAALAVAGRAAVTRAGGQIDAIVFTGHMSAPCLVDGTGDPVAPVRTLADTQCTPYLSTDAAVADLTGNLDGTHFGRAKIRQALDEGARPVSVLAPKDLLRHRLGGSLASDPGDLANLLLVDIGSGAFHDDLITGADLHRDQLPRMMCADQRDGVLNADWAARLDLPQGVPLITGTGDMGAAAIGVGLARRCDAAITIGTSATVLAAMPDLRDDLRGKLTCHLDGIGGRFALASHFNGGAVLDWLHRLSGTQEARNPWLMRLSSAAARRPVETRPLVLPYLLGSGSPRFDRAETAQIMGVTADHDMVDLVAAFQEGVAFDIADSFDALADAGLGATRVCLGGGGAKLPGWAETISAVLARPLARASGDDLSLFGAAMLGLQGIGASVAAADAGPDGEPGWLPDPGAVAALRLRRTRVIARRSPTL
ncbi:FGGY family carbohydrate kinase [Pseudooceanicola aestuarii]|uniref:FGGY family carbohydrate kinase n=1 Tax=Pseudooceanicola aestuarii TaxID=2697319 RepID=UPI0013D6024B|nr:FGGY family carbohydrate kinase [Pseudooceanicola aestuarii]